MASRVPDIGVSQVAVSHNLARLNRIRAVLAGFDRRDAVVGPRGPRLVPRIRVGEAHENERVLARGEPVYAGIGSMTGHHVELFALAKRAGGLECFHVGVGLRRKTNSRHAELVGIRSDRNWLGARGNAAGQQRSYRKNSDFHGVLRSSLVGAEGGPRHSNGQYGNGDEASITDQAEQAPEYQQYRQDVEQNPHSRSLTQVRTPLEQAPPFLSVSHFTGTSP